MWEETADGCGRTVRVWGKAEKETPRETGIRIRRRLRPSLFVDPGDGHLLNDSVEMLMATCHTKAQTRAVPTTQTHNRRARKTGETGGTRETEGGTRNKRTTDAEASCRNEEVELEESEER